MMLRSVVRIYSVIGALLVLLIGGILRFAEDKHNEAQSTFARQVQIELTAQELLQSLTDRETGQRGFLLTLDPQFIDSYEAAGNQIGRLLTNIKPAMDPLSWTELETLIKERADYFELTFQPVGGLPQQQQQQQQQQQEAIERVRSGDGKRYMDIMRAHLERTTETAKLEAEKAEQIYQSVSRRTHQLINFSSILLLVLLLAPGLFVTRAVTRPLKRLGEALEQLIKERQQTISVDRHAATEAQTITRQIIAVTDELLHVEQELEGKLSELETTRCQQDKVFAIVGHELRTPAAAIKMLLNEERQLNHSDYVVEAEVHATHLLNVLEDMRLSTSGDALLEVAEQGNNFVRVFKLLKSAILALQPLADKHQFTIDLHGEVANTTGHSGNPKVLQQIFQNLIRNAILHSEGSAINISMTYQHLEKNKTHFTIEVRDNGKGIPIAFRARMFNAFERGESVSGGTGLGLNIAYELANVLPDGELAYRDNPEGGAIFTLDFTLDKMVAPLQDPVATTTPFLGLNILLAEDTPTLRLLTKTILERAGATVRVAEDGESAINELVSFDADLVLTDIMMPNMNGYELTGALRQRGYTKPIIGVTGATVGMEAKRLLESGADYVLAKPLSVINLEAALKSLDRDGSALMDTTESVVTAGG